MKEHLITFDTAVIAKEKEFFDKNYYKQVRLSQDYFYDGGRVLHSMKQAFSSQIDLATCYNAPTQSILQQWLRDTHNIHIEILLSDDIPYDQFYFRIMTIGKYFSLSHDGIYKNSYEEALEAALYESLKLI